MSPDDLLAEARAATGLDDFGGDDFREGLAVYCESAASEAKLSDVGVMAVHGNIASNLANRLRVVDWASRHPEVARQPIDAPLIVVGMFRAGTTFLSNLLDQDPHNRSLLRWEAGDSVPPPTPANFRSGPRVDAARAGAEMLEQLTPAMAAIHHEEADGPTECVAVMSQDFKSLSWEAIANVPAYGEWLLGVDQRSAYEYHRLVLQVLQHGGVGGRWTLKSPHHALALEALTTVYPDARLVLLHRDPVVLCASVCSLIRTLSGTFSDADHGRYIAEHWTAMLETSISRIDGFRAAHPGTPILDVQYHDLVRQPVDTVARIYDAVGDGLTDEARVAIEAYVTANGEGKRGVHRYDLAGLGLDPPGLAERFASYVDRYDIPAEPIG
jgi:sulfotransferase family protein